MSADASDAPGEARPGDRWNPKPLSAGRGNANAADHHDRARYGFRVGPTGFLFPKDCTGEVVIAPEICPIPYTRAWMLGIVSLRGNLLPVFDLEHLLFETPIPTHKPMVLILDQQTRSMGFVLKNSPEWLTALTPAASADIPVPDILKSIITRCYKQADTVWLDVDKKQLFTFLGENAKSC
ncbi:MAG: chemotaxis protein CheW [Gammaproteobacteria bacterium]